MQRSSIWLDQPSDAKRATFAYSELGGLAISMTRSGILPFSCETTTTIIQFGILDQEYRIPTRSLALSPSLDIHFIC
jgi:hypothetical protein